MLGASTCFSVCLRSKSHSSRRTPAGTRDADAGPDKSLTGLRAASTFPCGKPSSPSPWPGWGLGSSCRTEEPCRPARVRPAQGEMLRRVPAAGSPPACGQHAHPPGGPRDSALQGHEFNSHRSWWTRGEVDSHKLEDCFHDLSNLLY